MSRQPHIFRALGPILIALFLCILFLSCGRSDEPFVIGDSGETEGPSAGPGEGLPGDTGACVVEFKALIQLKLSANPQGASSPLEILDADPFEISSNIPIRVEGNQLSLVGSEFPHIFFRPEETAADVKISAKSDHVAEGTYDPETGAMEFENFIFVLEIVKKGEEELFLEGKKELSPLTLTTGAVQSSGNLNSIDEIGQEVNPEDQSLILAAGITLPEDFGPLAPLNSIIGGGALTARFEGFLDQLPENCSSEAGGFSDSEPISGLRIQVANQASFEKIDFGNTTVLPRNHKGKLILDCREAFNRGLVEKRVTLSSTGAREIKLQLPQPKDLDEDGASPLCSGTAEFVRGSVLPEGGASCVPIQVGGKTFHSGRCTLPANSQAKLSFSLMYLPFNFEAAGENGSIKADRGRFTVFEEAGENFSMELLGRSLPDVSDSFSLTKVFAESISPNPIFRGGLLKIRLDEAEEAPAEQNVLLRNSGVEIWDPVEFHLEKGTHFQVTTVDPPVLPAGSTDGPGILEFKVIFEPGEGIIFQDVLHVTMSKQGSVSAANPQGITAKFHANILGTVGVPPLEGKWKLHFDFFTALIDHVALSEPIESNDFRQRPDLAVAPLDLEFSASEIEGIQDVVMDFRNINILDPNLTPEDRKKVLRIFTSRASRRASGDPFALGDTVDQCEEPINLNQPYQNGDCSYFYWTVENSPVGRYNDETGHLTLPSISMRMLNPYHADILGIWPASQPGADPDYILDVPIQLSFTTQLLNQLVINGGELMPQLLVPDERILLSDLVMRDKRLGAECPENFLTGEPPRLKCYLTEDEKFLTGMPLTLRPGYTDQYFINLVGVTRLPPGNTDPDLPWFLGDDGGSRLYIAIQGRLCPEASSCEF